MEVTSKEKQSMLATKFEIIGSYLPVYRENISVVAIPDVCCDHKV